MEAFALPKGNLMTTQVSYALDILDPVGERSYTYANRDEALQHFRRATHDGMAFGSLRMYYRAANGTQRAIPLLGYRR